MGPEDINNLRAQRDVYEADVDDLEFVLRALDMQPGQNTVRMNVRGKNFIGRLRADILRKAVEAQLCQSCEFLSLATSKLRSMGAE